MEDLLLLAMECTWY